MVKQIHSKLISQLMSSLKNEDKEMCQSIIDYLLELGYVPQKQKVKGYVLSFTNNQVKQTIAKIGTLSNDEQRAFFSIKFYACKNPPQKFLNAVQQAIVSSNMQYRCCGCNACGAREEDRGYHFLFPDGDEFIRCGAYVVKIPDLNPEDITDFRKLLQEQHEYFLTRNKIPVR